MSMPTKRSAHFASSTWRLPIVRSCYPLLFSSVLGSIGILSPVSVSDMSSLLRTLNRTATRQLQNHTFLSHCSSGQTPTNSLSYSLQKSRSSLSLSSSRQFSAMTALRSNPAMAGVREFDPEIKDMASYIHNYKVDSDLAVGCFIMLPRELGN